MFRVWCQLIGVNEFQATKTKQMISTNPFSSCKKCNFESDSFPFPSYHHQLIPEFVLEIIEKSTNP
jgi:hypothetical protein